MLLRLDKALYEWLTRLAVKLVEDGHMNRRARILCFVVFLIVLTFAMLGIIACVYAIKYPPQDLGVFWR